MIAEGWTLSLDGASLRPVRDAGTLQAVVDAAADFHALLHGQPPEGDEGEALLRELPPAVGRSDKLLCGVFDSGGVPVGLLSAYRGYPAPGDWFLGDLVLAPGARGAGLGARVLRAFESSVRAAGAAAIELVVDARNPGALRFWEREGFRRAGGALQRVGGRENAVVRLRRELGATPPAHLLRATEVLDADHPAVRARAAELAAGCDGPAAVARRAFEWVRDAIPHAVDAGIDRVPCAASEVLAAGAGLCYAKSHLLVALLRARGIPAGLCYQRLAGAPGAFALHGLAAVRLDGAGWYRIDPRGNRFGVEAGFSPPDELLAFQAASPGEWDARAVYPDPLADVVAALRAHRTLAAISANLPDAPEPPVRPGA